MGITQKDGVSMSAKEYLQQIHRLDTIINQKLKELDDLRIKLTSVGSFDYSKERVQTSLSGDAPFVRTIEQIDCLEEEINTEIDKLARERHNIINQIQSLKNANETSVLHKRYVEFLTFERIAVDMDYTMRNIYFIHGKALQHFAQMFLYK